MKFFVIAAAGLMLHQDASKCGTEIEWRSKSDAAAADAKAAGRLILWYVHTVQDTPMDRKDVVDTYMKTGPWMMRDVVALVNRKFIPLRMAGAGPLAVKCGVARMAFIEPGLVFLTPDLKPVHRVDRISTFSEDWMMDLLRGVLAANKEFNTSTGTTALELMAEGDYDAALKAADSPLVKGKILRRMRKPAEAAEAFAAAKDTDANDLACEEGILLLKQAKFAEAVEKFSAVKDGGRAAEAAYLKGSALYLLNRSDDGDAAWKTAAADAKSPWSWKAAAELARTGPFFRCFEELTWLPTAKAAGLPATTTVPHDLATVTKRSVALLLRSQRQNGSWNDSNYSFGGMDSLPNVYMAGTALAVSALLAWKEIDPAGVQAAIDRAWPYLNDEKNMAVDDEDEVIWGYAYRLDTIAAIIAEDEKRKKDGVTKMTDIVTRISKLQKKTGIWQHEYDAPFTTATVLLALGAAKKAGAFVADDMLKKGAEALAACRNPKGIFSYDYERRGDYERKGSGGRNPVCELALLHCSRSSPIHLKAAVDTAFELHPLLEKVRKYDDHADAYQNGGFFFWYDMVGRAEAIQKLPGDKAPYQAKQRDLVLSIAEIDGTFVDSHELGKTYGTAMGLLTLKALK